MQFISDEEGSQTSEIGSVWMQSEMLESQEFDFTEKNELINEYKVDRLSTIQNEVAAAIRFENLDQLRDLDAND